MSRTQLSNFYFHGKTLLYTKTCFSSLWLYNNPPAPNLASSNNKLLLCHGPVESRVQVWPGWVFDLKVFHRLQ